MEATRKSLAVFYADVSGYSRLTELDEVGTHRRVMSMLDHSSKAIVDAGGKVLRYAGDAILASFTNVIDAIEASASIQDYLVSSTLADKNSEAIFLRIGINFGDVIEDRGEVFGEGVNLAARLEAAAIPGGICISDQVFDHINSKVSIQFRDGGATVFKNIKNPVVVYHWTPRALPNEIIAASAKTRKVTQKPSVAILPFSNVGNDEEQNILAEGLTDDIMSAISRNRWYNVVTSNSRFALVDPSMDIRQIGADLGVDFVLKGSVRKSSNRLRITVQLIDAITGSQEWSNKFDRDLGDLFDLQDEITQRVASILSEAIWQSVAKNIKRLETGAYGPYEWCYSAIGLIHQLDPESNALAIERLTKAFEIDQEVAVVHLGLGFCHLINFALLGDVEGGALDTALEHAEAYQRLAPDDAHCYRLFSRIYTAKGKLSEAKNCVERAMKLNPDDSDIIINKGVFLLQLGEFRDALRFFDDVLAVHTETPHTVDIAQMWRGVTFFMLDDLEQSLFSLRDIAGLKYLKNLFIAACLAESGNPDDAIESVSVVLKAQPKLKISSIGFWKGFVNASHGERIASALQKAGIPR
jgi:TolB-like protein/class 3 adenylate cyclase